MFTASAQLFLALFTLFSLICCRRQDINDNNKQEYYVNDPEVKIYEGSICDCPQPAEFARGDEAWTDFLRHNLNYPPDECIQGKVIVRFMIDTNGVVKDIHAISGPKDVRPYAIALIQKSPNWNPARLRGQKINDYKYQPIIFKLGEE